ncbi:hypothetical protein ACLOJK_040353 [Asimina triloba]
MNKRTSYKVRWKCIKKALGNDGELMVVPGAYLVVQAVEEGINEFGLDDPYSRTFERCSTDTFTISGPCTYQICYLYLFRRGSDGWKPESVKVYPPNSRGITFTYNKFLPNGVWYGFNLCNGGSSDFDADRNFLSHI